MKTFSCRCGNRLFFENTQCIACGAAVGWCPACSNVVALLPDGDERVVCAREGCGARLIRCHNYAIEGVCNRCCVMPDPPALADALCDYCRFNDTIPDLSRPGNREKWRRLEEAKRRLLYTLDLLRLPYGGTGDPVEPPLAFDFKEDVQHPHRWTLGEDEGVYTGHVNGKITIDLREADTVAREKARVAFQERHRTLIGHFRHEIGHYYWQVLVAGRREEECRDVFGDHENPTYADAQQRYYEQGPPDGWEASHVSGYATMHPWEDFAETFATLLDMVSVLHTAKSLGALQLDPVESELQEIVDAYAGIGVLLNEMNRAMGLVDLVPEVFTPAIVAKLGFVHGLVREAAPPG